MFSAWLWRSALGLAIIALPAEAGATPNDLGVFGYHAPAECPNQAEFSAQVAARTSAWLSPSSPFSVAVAIERDTQGLLGRVTFARAEQRTVRDLRADGCTELVQALAFIVAVLIDPQAGTTPVPPPGEGRPPPVYPWPAVAPAPRSVAPAIWFVAGPEFAIQTDLAREVAIGERLFFGIGRGDRSLLMSSARLSLGRAATHMVSPRSGDPADFVLETTRVEGCLLRLSEGSFAFEPCPFVELGRLRATGGHPSGNVTHHQFWGSLGLVFRPTWTFSQRLVLGAGLGVELPLTPYRFAFTGEPELTRTPAVALEASLCLGLRFP